MDTNKNNRNRRKAMYVPQDFVASVFSRGMRGCEYVRLLNPVGLPETAELVGVWESFRNRAFVFIFTDASFEEVEEGVECPRIEVRWEQVRVDLAPLTA